MRNEKVLIIDNGLFIDLAEALAKQVQKVYYFSPWVSAFPTLEAQVIGDTPYVHRILEPLGILDVIDVVIFPDLFHKDLQHLLRDVLGMRVWGSMTSQWLELNRQRLREEQQNSGLNTPTFTIIEGYSALVEFLQKHFASNSKQHLFVKATSRLRGTMETWCAHSYTQSMLMLHHLATKLGPALDSVTFVVEWPIETELETGIDTYTVHGQFPETMLQGYEIKSEAYLGSVLNRNEMPSILIDQSIKPFARRFELAKASTFCSWELRFTKDRKVYLIDPCIRAPSPGFASQLHIYKNLADIIIDGAEGKLTNPEIDESIKFTAELAITHDGDPKQWRVIEVPESIRPYTHFINYCQIDNQIWIAPVEPHTDRVGWIVAAGPTIESVTEQLKEITDALDGQPVRFKHEAIAQAIDKARLAEEQRLFFSEQKAPVPEVALDTKT